MFEDSQTRAIPSDSYEQSLAGLAWAAGPHGRPLARVSPVMWMGKTAESSYGFVLDTRVHAVPMGQWTNVTIKLEMSVEDKGALLLFVSWVLCFPAAVVLWLLAWSDYSKRKQQLFYDLWRGSEGNAPPMLAAAAETDPYRLGSGFERRP